MTAITPTSPLDLGALKKTQRRVAALLNVPEYCVCTGRRKRIPAGFCYVCSQLDPRGRGRGANPYRHLLARGLLKACPHLPPAPHPTFVSLKEDEDDDYEDDGFDEESFDLGDGGSQDGGMFDTAIVREDNADPRLFSLPPVFGGSKDGQQQQEKKKRRNKNGRLVPLVSENTFLTTNKRGEGRDPDLDETAAAADGKVAAGRGADRKASDLRLPRLPNQRASLVAEGKGQGHGAGQGQGRRKEKDPRRLHSERIDRRPVNGSEVDRFTRSDSAIGLERTDTELTREKTDPPPQPIVVSIKDQDGTVLQKIPIENLPPGTGAPTEAFTANNNDDQQQQKTRKKRARKQRRDDDYNRYGSASPTFSGSISISRETTLSGYESPDFEFMSRLRSASWCECPDHARHAEAASRASSSGASGSCPECRKSHGQHEKWCVSRNSVCQRCGKAFKRKYPHLERKTSFGTIPAGSGAAAKDVAHSPTASSSAAKGSLSQSHHRRHQNCSPTKSLSGSQQNLRFTRDGLPEVSATSNRVRFHEDGSVVYPQWDSFAKSEDDKAGNGENKDPAVEAGDGDEFEKTRLVRRSHFRNAFDADIHRRAYDLALADAKTKQLFQPSKKKKQTKDRLLDGPKGIYFSYFPRLKRRKPEATSSGGDDEGGRAGSPKSIGVRADSREGKQLKVKKGLKHVLGSTKLEDYYPGGKCYPR